MLQSEDGQFFVESEKGKVLYDVVLGDDSNTWTCGDGSITRFSTKMYEIEREQRKNSNQSL